MLIEVFHGKIHRATVTETNLNYMGSITIDSKLLTLAGLLPGEKVQVVDNDNGNRLETYIIAGEAGSGEVCLNGAAARMVALGDTVIIIGYALVTPEEARAIRPKVVMVDARNHPVEVRDGEIPHQIC